MSSADATPKRLFRCRAAFVHTVSRNRLDIALVLAALLLYAGTDIWQNLSWPVFFSHDETLEIDYIYRIAHGALPEFYDGQRYNPLGLPAGELISVQFRYQHPPLFYLLEVPIFLVFQAETPPFRAIWAMRGLVFVLGCALIIVARWAAKWIFGGDSPLTALVPFIVAANRCLGSVVFNYTLATLWVTLLIGMTAKLIRTLPGKQSRSTTLWWTSIVTLAPLTRLSTVPIALLCLLSLGIRLILLRQHTVRRLSLFVALPGFLAVLSSAWFYIRLHALSGNMVGTQTEWSSTALGRNIHGSFTGIATSADFWKHALSQYQNAATVSTTSAAWLFVITLTALPLLLGCVALIRFASISLRGATHRHAAADLIIMAMLVVAFAGTTFQQILFVRQGGQNNAVYFSLINIVFASVIAAGFLQLRPAARTNAITLWLAIRLGAMMLEAHMQWPRLSTPGNPLAQAGAYISLAMVTLAVVWAASLFGSCRSLQFSLDRPLQINNR